MAATTDKNASNQTTSEPAKNGSIFLDLPIIPEIGIIYPPPEMRNIIDKTAEFVFKNGIEFEEKIRNKEAQNPKFSFLNRNDPYFKYYKHVYYDFTLYPNREKAPSKPSFLPPAVIQPTKAEQAAKRSAATQRHCTIIDLSDPVHPSSHVQPFEFYTDVPPLSPVDLNIVKVTAQFVAKNGRNFLQDLLQREMKNYFFDFVKPQHAIYPYFIKLVDQYSKIINPTKEFIADLRNDVVNNRPVLDKVRARFEWIRYNDSERKKEFDKSLKERNIVNAIDWNEFIVVETISFREDEQANLPPPVIVDQLGARLIAQDRFEKVKGSLEQTVEESNQIIAEDEPPAKIQPKDSDNKRNESNAAISTIKTVTKSKIGSNMMISPITGELVPADKLDEHIRMNLLDPKYKEQKQKFLEEKRQLDLMQTSGTSMTSHLKELANRRSDIFGPGHEETTIGKKLEEKGDSFVKKAAPVNFDPKVLPSHSTNNFIEKTVESVTRLPPPITPKPFIPNTPRVVLPPPLPSRNTISNSSISSQGLAVSAYSNMDRPRYDEELIPAISFLADYGGAPINIQVRIPLLPDLSQKHNWQLHGQIEHLTVSLDDTIMALKLKIQEKVGMPPSKQKILIGATRFGKDNNSLAFYNIHSNTYIALQLKERGGQK